MSRWKVERVVHFGPKDLCRQGFVHFGFHDRDGRQFLIEHQKHFLGLVGEGDRFLWTAGRAVPLKGIPNIEVDLKFPIYVDVLRDGRLVVSNFGDGRLYALDVRGMKAELFVDGPAFGIKCAGNCVVDDAGYVWLNEVDGCRIWRFDPSGKAVLTLGDGRPGFQRNTVPFGEARFNWIYDIRKGPDGNIYVLDSRNFALRLVDLARGVVKTLAGTGVGGYDGDGGPAGLATLGSDPSARFDGPISLSLDEGGNIFVGDRFNHVVRRIDRSSGIIETIAGRHSTTDNRRNAPGEKEPLRLNLPKISSMDYFGGRLYVPTDLTADAGDLAILSEDSRGTRPRRESQTSGRARPRVF